MKAISSCFRKSDQADCVAVFIMLLAVLLSAIQFFLNRSLWMDEASLAINIISRDFAGLFHPLDHNQVAPILYLQLTKAFSLLTPTMEYGLRIIPMISFWASLLLFYRSLKVLFKDDFVLILVLSLFAFNPTVLYYSGEVKQYATDVFVAVLFLFLLVRKYYKPNSRFVWLALAGMVAIWLSNIAPMVLTGAGSYLLFQAKRGNAAWMGRTVLVGLLWLASFAVYYLLFVRDHPTWGFQLTYWQNERAFLPTNLFSMDFLLFLKEKAGLLGNLTFSRKLLVIIVFLGLTLVGYASLLRGRSYALLVFLVVPFLVHLLLSALTLYPFGRRLVLYQVPLLIIASGYGVHWLLETIRESRLYPILRKGVLLIPIVLLLPLWGSFPKERQEIKKSIRFISEHALEGQQLFLPSGSISAFTYYRLTGFAESTVFSRVIKVPWAWTNERTLHEFMTGVEGACWVLFSHDGKELEVFLLDQASRAGLVPVKSFKTVGSSAYLFFL